MPDGFWLGLLVGAGALALAAAALAAFYLLLLVAASLWGRYAPAHWWLSGPMRRPVPADQVFRNVDVAGGRASTLRRLLRFGPWAFYVVRYRPGPTIPTSDRPAVVRRRHTTREESR